MSVWGQTNDLDLIAAWADKAVRGAGRVARKLFDRIVPPVNITPAAAPAPSVTASAASPGTLKAGAGTLSQPGHDATAWTGTPLHPPSRPGIPFEDEPAPAGVTFAEWLRT